MRKIIPAFAGFRVVLAHSTPLAFGEIRSPAFPVFLPGGVFLEALRLGVLGGFEILLLLDIVHINRGLCHRHFWPANVPSIHPANSASGRECRRPSPSIQN